MSSSSSSSSSVSGLSNSSTVASMDDRNRNRFFTEKFSVSLFRRDMIINSMEQFPSCYNLRNIGQYCILFIQAVRGTWTPLDSTKTFHHILMSQMNIRGKINEQGYLSVKLAFGLAKDNEAFDDNDIANGYLLGFDDDDSDEEPFALTFSQDGGRASSPKLFRSKSSIKDATNRHGRDVLGWINRHYRNSGCSLYFGILDDHRKGMQRYIVTEMYATKGNPLFKEAIDSGRLLTNEELSDNVLTVYNERYAHEVPGYPIGANLYPPINPSIIVPPTLREHEKRKENEDGNFKTPFAGLMGDVSKIRAQQLPPGMRNTNILSNLLQSHSSESNFNISPSAPTPILTTPTKKSFSITFKDATPENDNEPVGVMIRKKLNVDSKMGAVLKDADLENEFGLGNDKDCRYCIEKDVPSNDFIRYCDFSDMTVAEVIETDNIKNPYSILVKLKPKKAKKN